MTIRLVFVVVLLIFSIQSYSQEKSDSLLKIWNDKTMDDAARAKAYNLYISKNYVDYRTDSAYIFVMDLMKFIEDKKLTRRKPDALITLGNIQYIIGDYPKAIKNYTKSLDYYKKEQNKKGEANSYKNIGRIYRANWSFDDALKFYRKSLEIGKKISDTLTIATSLLNIGNIYGLRYKSDEALKYYAESVALLNDIGNDKNIAIAKINIGASYIAKKEYVKAESELRKAIAIGKAIDNNNVLAHAYSVLAQSYFKQNNYDLLIDNAKSSYSYAKKASNKAKLRSSHYFLFEGYRGKKNFDSTFYHYEKQKEFMDEREQIQTAITLQEMRIKSIRDTDSLLSIKRELRASLDHQKEKSTLTIAWGGSLSAVSIFAFLIYRNTKRKQHKAEKERQEQIEEKEKILKDLELSTIDAMIEGQEKERERLAADLHDSVGASLAAAKLQFDYLIKNQNDAKYSEKLIKKTSTLLEEAYVEIRTMAHLKNSGVMAKNGLLPAIVKLTENASGINGLTFEVQSFGLEQRLENSLEISVFRIIQELVRNIIKHAKATQGIVHLTNHNDSLNIMVEDNGIGFNPNKINTIKKGMGISSIDKRVGCLDGKFTIESNKNKGTSIIIDIPL